MLQHPAAVRAAFDRAADTFLATLAEVRDEQWEQQGLGAFTVRQLVAHTLRAFTTIEMYVNAEPTVDRLMADGAEYYRTVLADPGIHESVLQRGRDAGARLADPLGEAEATAQRVRALVASTADDDPVNTFAGQIEFSEYLATRVVELAVHTVDLQRAVGRRASLHTDTSDVVLAVLTSVADPLPVILALTGRAALPDGFNALG
jgi:uncharacterized protein (TIGR03083 family)